MLVLVPEDAALRAAVQAACADLEVRGGRFRLEGWLQALYGEPPVGAVLDTDRMSLAELQAVAASRLLPQAPWLLLLVGDRGLAGCERLLADPRAAVLPRPWTEAGVRTAVDRLQQMAPRGEAFPGGFVEGMVEGLRDPLTALSGYLQLLGGEAGDAGASLLDPALAAAEDLETQLQLARMAARPAAPRTETLEAADSLRLAQQDAERVGLRPAVEADAPADALLEADPQALRAALAAARRLLTRFGPGGPLTLFLQADEDGVLLGWRADAGAAATGSSAPPPYLPLLFERLAARVPAEPLLDRAHGTVPVLAALRWAPSV